MASIARYIKPLYISLLDHGTDLVNVVVVEEDDAFRAGAHTRSATTAARGVGHRIALFVLVQSTEGTFFRTTLALRAAHQVELGEGQIARTGVNSHAPIRGLKTLSCLQIGRASCRERV